MKYKEFVAWCNERACDGQWSGQMALVCTHIIADIRMLPFWKREKAWQNVNCKYQIERNFVSKEE